MKRIVRLTERDLTRIVRRVIKEQMETTITLPTNIGSINTSGGWKKDGDSLTLYSEEYKEGQPINMSHKVLYQFDELDLGDSWNSIPTTSDKGTWTKVSNNQIKLTV